VSAVVEGLVTGWAIAVPLGAVGTILVLHSARAGTASAVAAATGIATVDGGYALAAAVGSVAVGRWVEAFSPVLTPLAAGALLWIAITIVMRSFRTAPVDADGYRGFTVQQSYWSFLGITSINPLTLAYFAAVVTGGLHVVGSLSRVTLFALGAFAGSFTGHLIWVACGLALKPAVITRRGRIVTSSLGAAVVAAMALRMLV
jgi:threonine/homoserine/homoserine lactone efflux protein